MPANPSHCPYCGYDLRAVYASWKNSCPLRMMCSECGHEFEPGWLLGREYPEPPARPIVIRRRVVASLCLLYLLVVLVSLAWSMGWF